MFGIFVYLAAVCAAAAAGFGLYCALAPVTRLGLPARWFGRTLATVAAALAFVSVIHATGQGAMLSRRRVAGTWREDLTVAVLLGVAYAAIWFVRDAGE
jgi:hypothetical protein